MNKVIFKHENAVPHPSFKGVMLCPILNESEMLGIRSTFVLIPEGCELSPHTHDVVEVFTVLSGNPLALIDGEWTRVIPGTTIVAPPGEHHGMKNDTKEDILLQANFNVK